ncbi:CHAT domain-containing protein [Marinoscillum furvescens]|uniref:Tetratricopeptide repeat protein n=1 Tax=Marinoscillum furvescens DSM 4134 TaxID=1122208 RepID=A0A3D9KYX8_MARFU|nr:CHAT domain-containing protein [Marinoscillum furvescens]RED91772.1 tetratricopeptide repeat protein [Marinoscillum furvescens DSM 4134]
MYASKNSPKRIALLLFALMPFCLHAQTWEVLFKKAEKQVVKGKYHKVEKHIAKLRKKHIAKKYGNDESLVPLTYVMEAKANYLQADFEAMHRNAATALSELEKWKVGHPYNYTMGLLRLVDLYNTYGNHRLADSLTTMAEQLSPAYTQTELLDLEIKMRRAFTDVALGRYNQTRTLLQELINTWPTKLRLSYSFDKVTGEDIAYKTQLLVKLFTAEIEILRKQGKYEEALKVADERNKQVNRLAPAKSEAYVHFRVEEARTHLDYGDIKQADRLSARIVALKPPGRLMQTAGELNMLAAATNENSSAAISISNQIKAALIKAKVDREFTYFISDYHSAILKSLEEDPGQNLVVRFNRVLGKSKKLLPADHRIRTEACEHGLSYIYSTQRSENFPFAERFYNKLGESMELRYGPQSLAKDIYKVNLAGYYLKYSEKPRKAFDILQKEPYKRPLDELSTIHPDYERIVSDLMEYFTLVGNFDYPIKLTKEVLQALESNPNVTKEAIGDKMVELAKLQIQGGYYKDAEYNTDEGMKLIRRGGERKSEEYVFALNNAAYLYGTIGLYSKAERYLRRSQSIYKKLSTVNQELRLQSIVDLAFLYTRIGEYTQTEELLNQVISERRRLYGSQSRRLIKPYAALGEMYLIRGDYPEAEKNMRQALTIAEKVFGDSTLIFAQNLSKLVKLYLELGNYEAALVNATDVLQIREQTLRDKHILFADTYNDLGHIHYYLKSDLEVVDRYYTLAKDIVLNNFSDTHPLYAEALRNLASVALHRQQYDEALQLLDQADEIWKDALANLNPSSGEVAKIKGDIYTLQGEFKDARKEYEKASRYFKILFSEEHPDYLNTQSRLARAYFISNELNKVEDILSETTTSYLNYTQTYFPTLSEDEKAKFWNKIKGDFEFYNTVAVKYSSQKEKYLENMYDFALATKGLLLNTSIKTRNSILNSGDSTLINLFKDWVSKKEFLTATLAQSQEQLTQNEIDIPKLKEEIALLEKQLSEKSSAFQESFEHKLYEWKDVRKALEDNEAAIEIVRYREFDSRFNEDKVRYAALILTSETRKNPELVLLENGLDMETRHFKYLRNTTKYKLPDNNSFGVYWEAIYEKIQDKEIVYLSPDGVYNQLNVEALKINDTDYVIDRMNVRVVNNTKTIAALRSKDAIKATKDEEPKAMSAMLMGNPLYYQNEENLRKAMNEPGGQAYVPQLPGTEREVKHITELLEQRGWSIAYYLGENATEDQIKQAQNYTLVHIATHGFFDDKSERKSEAQLLLEEDDNPLDRSGLLAEGGGDVLVKATKNYNIDDGVLTAHEAMNLNFENTELIVLSACETGRGEIQQGEGVFGLQRSFLVAGADAIIMSLFQVSDEVTQQLMVEFYKNWLEGQDKRTAFNNAQRKIKQTYANPIYWGAFTMIAKS